MSDAKLRTLFLGSPQFAVPSLEALCAAQNLDVVLVMTQPDRPAGRGRRMCATAVKETALLRGIPVLEPLSIKEADFKTAIEPYLPLDVAAMAAYGLYIPRWLRELPRLGMINAHPSLLPKYRGAAPVPWALVNGESVTGLTIQTVGEKMDAGDILWQKPYNIAFEDNASTLLNKMSHLAAEAFIETINSLAAGTAKPQPQNDADATFAPKIKPEDGLIDWNKSAAQIRNLVRGMIPFPCAWTTRGGAKIKIYEAEAVVGSMRGEPGRVLEFGRRGITVACGEGALRIICLQPENKKPMAACDFINGCRLEAAEKWGE